MHTERSSDVPCGHYWTLYYWTLGLLDILTLGSLDIIGHSWTQGVSRFIGSYENNGMTSIVMLTSTLYDHYFYLETTDHPVSSVNVHLTESQTYTSVPEIIDVW